MKSMIITCMLLVGMTGATYAQKQKPQVERTKITIEQRAERQTESLAQILVLSDAQRQSIYQVNLATSGKMKAQREQSREAAKLVRQEQDRQYKEILTAEQYDTYLQHKKDMREKRKGEARARPYRPAK